jgi:hypothetical protein
MLRKDLQISVEQKKDLRSTNHYFPVFFSACSSAVAILENCVCIFVPRFELEHVVSQKRTVHSKTCFLISEIRSPSESILAKTDVIHKA